jgi:hypothetical protein
VEATQETGDEGRRLRRDGLIASAEYSLRRTAAGRSFHVVSPTKVNARWSLDFIHDQLACGRRFCIFGIVDDVTRDCLMADTSISGVRAARELTALIERHGKPKIIVSDHGTELTSNAILG